MQISLYPAVYSLDERCEDARARARPGDGLAAAGARLPGNTSNLQINRCTWTDERQMGGSHHHKNAPAHLSARAPPTTPQSASLHYTNNFFFERLKQHLSQRALARLHKKQWR